MTQPVSWQVLLIGGVSGAGKSTVAMQLGLRVGIPWMQVDDLRLALIRSRVTLPERTDSLYFFQSPEAWQKTPAQFCQGLIELGQVMSPAIEMVVENHVATRAPLILEGDAIQPALLDSPVMQEFVAQGQVQVVFLTETNEQALLQNMLERGRGIEEGDEQALRTEAAAKWLYNQWLLEEAQHYHLPVVQARPWSTLLARIAL